MKKIFYIILLIFSISLNAQEKKNYLIHLTSDPMQNPSAAFMSINAASEALKQGHNTVYFAAGDGVKILMNDIINNLHTVTMHGGNTNNLSMRMKKLLIDFANNGGVIHVSEGSFKTYGVSKDNSDMLILDSEKIKWSYPKELIQESSKADILFSY
ncbi:MAG: DsrE family protein [Bacteroidetes bacterium]|nr:DsrE family protein [Bacteroidota bacterium]